MEPVIKELVSIVSVVVATQPTHHLHLGVQSNRAPPVPGNRHFPLCVVPELYSGGRGFTFNYTRSLDAYDLLLMLNILLKSR